MSQTPQKCPFPWGIYTPSNTCSWTHSTQHPRLHLDRFSRFCTAHDGVPIGLLNSVRRNAINARFKKLIVAINAIKNLIVWQPQSFTISDSASKSSDRTVNISLQHCMYLLRCLALVDQQCPANGPVLAASCRRWVKRFYQLLSFFLWIFPQRLRIFNQNFTRLLRCVFALNYNTLFNYLTLSKLCHIKRDRPVNFHFCNTSKQR